MTLTIEQRTQVHSGDSRPNSSAILRLHLFGPFRAETASGMSVLPTGRKTRALLAILALSQPRSVSRSKLSDLLWSRRPEEQASASLRQEVHRLRDALGPVEGEVIIAGREHLSLKPGAVWVDVNQVLQASTADPGALVLLEGELLEGLDGADPNFDVWLTTEREHVVDRARRLAETLLEGHAEPEATIVAARQVLAIDRAHEGAWRALMRAYSSQGDQGRAIEAYRRCYSVLSTMLDTRPSRETDDLLAKIRSSAQPRARSGGGTASRLVTSPSYAAMEATQPLGVGQFREPEQHRLGDLSLDEAGPEVAERVRVGVLPLQLVGTLDQDACVSVGLSDEITAMLARSRSMFVMSSALVARFVAQSRDEADIRRELNLDFVVDGTVYRSGSRLRVSLRLIDLRTHLMLWSCKIDSESGDALALQDEVCAKVCDQIEIEITQ